MDSQNDDFDRLNTLYSIFELQKKRDSKYKWSYLKITLQRINQELFIILNNPTDFISHAQINKSACLHDLPRDIQGKIYTLFPELDNDYDVNILVFQKDIQELLQTLFLKELLFHIFKRREELSFEYKYYDIEKLKDLGYIKEYNVFLEQKKQELEKEISQYDDLLKSLEELEKLLSSFVFSVIYTKKIKKISENISVDILSIDSQEKKIEIIMNKKAECVKEKNKYSNILRKIIERMRCIKIENNEKNSFCYITVQLTDLGKMFLNQKS